MIQRESDIKPNVEKPFEGDVLSRQVYVENLSKILTQCKTPLVFALSSPWGTGKTRFLEFWNAYLQQQEFLIVNFNAWESDFADNALIALFGEFESFLDSKIKKSSKTRQLVKNVKRYGKVIAKSALPSALKLATYGILDIDKIKDNIKLDEKSKDAIAEFISKGPDKQLDSYRETKKAIENFRKELAKLVEASNHSRIFFFIDELDRCRPDFAIKLLEIIKHIFSVEGVVFVLAVDMQQLSQSAKVVYGSEMDCKGYFRRFIDLEYQLPEQSEKNNFEFFNHIYKQYGFVNRQQLATITDFQEFRALFNLFSDLFYCSLRDKIRIFNEISVNSLLVPNNYKGFGFLLFLTFLRVKNDELYHNFITRKIDGKQVIEQLIVVNSKFKNQFWDKEISYEIETYLLFAFKDNREFGALFTKIETQLKNAEPMDKKAHFKQILFYSEEANAINKAIFDAMNFSASFS
ncbi:MAG: P-loop NTPase fold protein [Bacteroidota bacterium]